MKTILMSCLMLCCLISTNVHADEATQTVEANESKLDFGDHSSSTLTEKGWKAFESKKYDDAVAYAKECIKKYGKEAIEMQEGLEEPVSTSDQEAVFSKWALNDVGTCYFILGQTLEAQEKHIDAMKAYKTLTTKLAFAQCWDPKGWFWKPADAAKKQIKMLEFKIEDDEEEAELKEAE